MEKGQIFEIVIEDMSSQGQGIGRAEGLVVFVPGAVVGDKVQVCLTKVKKSYAFSRLMKILEPAADRSEEFDCEFLENGCGGCPYGKLNYSAQVRVKEKQVKEKLQRLAGLDDPLVRPIIAMEEADNEGMGSYRYRNKAQFPVSTGGIITRKGGIVENLGEPTVGFYRARSHDVVDCEDCYLQSMAAMAAADALRSFMAEDNITAWDPKWQKGLLRHLIVKTAFATKEVMVILVVNGKGIPNSQKLTEMLDEAIYEVGYSLESVVLSIKKSDADNQGKSSKSKKKVGKEIGSNDMIFRSEEIMGEENLILAGSPVIRDVVGEMQFEISPESFYQVNPVQVKRLYDKVREYCGFDEEYTADEDKSLIDEAKQDNAETSSGNCDNNVDTDKCENGKILGSSTVIVRDNDDIGSSANKNATDVEDIASIENITSNENREPAGPIVLDLYCGVGTIGLYCADKAKAVIGIESVKKSVLDANRNAVINGIVNARYICGRAEEVLPEYVRAGDAKSPAANRDAGDAEKSKTIPKNKTNNNKDGNTETAKKIDPEIAGMIREADIAILDPPRAGCRPELLEAVADVGVDRIVYVSCDPATLARDIKLLGELGYEFKEATPVDMFPWTGHVETVVWLQKVK